jgi:sugar (pentulose or hexulose) kinase
VARDLILAIDNGTQRLRALVFDLQGNLVARSGVSLEAYVSPQPGWAEQDPEYYWRALCRACQELWRDDGRTEARARGEETLQSETAGSAGSSAAAKEAPRIPASQLRERIAGVTLTTQRATVVNVDGEGRPLRPAILWLDQRRTYGLKPVSGLWGLAFRLVNMSDTVAYLQAEAEANWIRTNQPDIWRTTHKYLLLSGYLTYKLTGYFVDSVGCQVGYLPFDYKRLDWVGRRGWQWQAVPMDPGLLPKLVPPSGQLGVISPEAAAATGLPAGLPLMAAAADKACEVIGAGCLEPHIGCLSYGTTATINTTHRKYVEVIPLIPPYPSAVPGSYNLEIQIFRGYWMVSWFKQQFGHPEQRLAEEQGVEPEALLDELVCQVPPGSLGLMLQPYWSPGVKVPGPEAKGAVIGFGDVHTRAHLYRAILEGLAYALREGKERTEKRSGVAITELRVGGGGSQSDAPLQITADIFGLPTARPHTHETSGLGAAIDAAVGLGLQPDFATAVRTMTRVGAVFQPDPQAHAIYDSLYHRVYRQMYHRLRPLYEEIRAITGYPTRIGE